MSKKSLSIILSAIFAISTYALYSYAKDNYDYPGKVDEDELKVQEELSSTYKRSRKYYESKVLRDLASTKEDEEE